MGNCGDGWRKWSLPHASFSCPRKRWATVRYHTDRKRGNNPTDASRIASTAKLKTKPDSGPRDNDSDVLRRCRHVHFLMPSRKEAVFSIRADSLVDLNARGMCIEVNERPAWSELRLQAMSFSCTAGGVYARTGNLSGSRLGIQHISASARERHFDSA